MKSIGLEESGNVSGGIQNIHDGLLAGNPGNDDKNVLIAGTDIEGMPIIIASSKALDNPS